MKMVLMLADANRIDHYREALDALGAPGYTMMPVLEGEGRTGLRAADRVHPGAMVFLFSVVEDALAETLWAGLSERRAASGDRVTRLFLMPVERVS